MAAWTNKQDETLKKCWGKVTVRQMVASGTFPGRTVRSVYMRATRLGLPAGEDRSWSRDEIATLRRYWGKQSASQIMALLPERKRSRNAIIGMAGRLGLGSGARARPQLKRDVVKKEGEAMPIEKVEKIAVAPPLPAAAPAGDDPFAPLPGCKPVHIYKLEQHHCRWPVSDREWLFCGCPRQSDGRLTGPYCAAHAEIAVRGAPVVKAA